MRHDTQVHRADHDLRTSPCDPNNGLFSVRTGQQSVPYFLSILTRKGTRAGEPGSPGLQFQPCIRGLLPTLAALWLELEKRGGQGHPVMPESMLLLFPNQPCSSH